MIFTVRQLMVLLVCAAGFNGAGCSKGGTRKSSTQPPQRDGDSLESISVRFSDLEPAISNDGTRVVFVSGRDSTETLGIHKIYKAEWPADGTPGAVTRLTGSDASIVERGAVISGDGSLVLVETLEAGAAKLVLVPFEGGVAPLALSSADTQLGGYGFSPDGRYAVWIERQRDFSGSALWLAEVTTDPAGIGEKTKISQDSEYIAGFVWLASADGDAYRLAAGLTDRTSGASVSYKQLGFSAPGEAATAERKDFVEGVLGVSGIQAQGAGAIAAFPVRLLSSQRKYSTKGGNSAENPRPQVLVKSEVQVADATSGEKKSFADPPGIELIAMDVLDSGTHLVMAMRSVFRCEGADKDTYGSGIVMADRDLTTASRFIPRLNAAGDGFEVVRDFCETTRADATIGRTDHRVESVRIAGGGTDAAFRMAYVSRFNKAFDSDCGLKTGDQEVYLMNWQGGAGQVYALSANQAALENEERAEGEAPCVL